MGNSGVAAGVKGTPVGWDEGTAAGSGVAWFQPRTRRRSEGNTGGLGRGYGGSGVSVVSALALGAGVKGTPVGWDEGTAAGSGVSVVSALALGAGVVRTGSSRDTDSSEPLLKQPSRARVTRRDREIKVKRTV